MAAYKLAFIYQSVLNGIINLMILLTVSHLVKTLIMIHKMQFKVKRFCL
jgi:hypothetical protein